MNQSRLLGCLIVMVMLATTATNSTSANDAFFLEHLKPFFQNHCVACHDADLSEGDLRLDNLPDDFTGRPAADHWIEVLDRINLGEMPPEGEPRPPAEDTARVAEWIGGRLADVRNQRESTGGKVLLRRMTRREYAATVRDLLHVTFTDGEGPMDRLPPDGSVRGFDRNSNALFVDPSLMNAYLEVATQIADQAIRFRPPLVPQRTIRFHYRDIVDSAMKYQIDDRSAYLDGDTLVLINGDARSFAKLRHPINNREVPITGRYRVRIQAAADPGESGEPIYMRIKQGTEDNIAQFRVDAPPNAPEIYEFETVRDEMLQGEYGVSIIPGTSMTQYAGQRGQQGREADQLLQSGKVELATTMKVRLRAQGEDITSQFRPEAWDLDRLPKLRLDWIEVTGPLQENYPPRSMTEFFFDGWDAEKRNPEDIEQVFSRFLPRAYRRPVDQTEIDRITGLVQAELDAGGSFEMAIETGIVAVLCSPKFLYLSEPSRQDPSRQDTGPRRLNEFELATRLSYFLWSSQPDETLFALAEAGTLSDPAVLLRQVDRMVADQRFEGFLDGFVHQWLRLDEFNQFPPDQAIFPEYYETSLAGIEADLVEQPLAMVRELIVGDGSLLDLLDSDWTMLNERLAVLYGVDGVSGDQMRRVSLNDLESSDAVSNGLPVGIRGGLLGMAGVHRWGSDGNRTKPVERGKYILDVLFNDPPPPPPPNAGEIEPNIRGEKLSVSERLELHRQQPTCMNCHRRIDPYGLALENFNVIGQWRTRADGEVPLKRWGKDRPEIHIGGTLPGGETYDSFASFKGLLSRQSERFLRGVTEKLLMYALARTIEPADRGLVNLAVQNCQDQGHTMRAIIRTIVSSDRFGEK